MYRKKLFRIVSPTTYPKIIEIGEETPVLYNYHIFCEYLETRADRHFRQRKKLFRMLTSTTYSNLIEIGDR